jgi:Protein of unknown function (DUF1488)
MPLTSGKVVGYDPKRMIFLFTMRDGGKEITCGVSTAAMDNVDGNRLELPRGQRAMQFIRLRSRIEVAAALLYAMGRRESGDPLVLVRSADLSSDRQSR